MSIVKSSSIGRVHPPTALFCRRVDLSSMYGGDGAMVDRSFGRGVRLGAALPSSRRAHAWSCTCRPGMIRVQRRSAAPPARAGRSSRERKEAATAACRISIHHDVLARPRRRRSHRWENGEKFSSQFLRARQAPESAIGSIRTLAACRISRSRKCGSFAATGDD